MSGKDVEYYKSVCRNELKHGNHGGFLVYLMEAYLRADHQNSILLLPTIKRLAEKHRLQPEGKQT